MGIKDLVRREQFVGQRQIPLMTDDIIASPISTPMEETQDSSWGWFHFMSHGIIPEMEMAEEKIIHWWETPQSEWALLSCTVIILVCLDWAFSKRLTGGNQGQKVHVCVLTVWLGVGMIFNGVYFARFGEQAGMLWFIGYFLEWMLSLDNLFAFQFIIRAYRCPVGYLQDKALFCGILGCLLTRAGMYLAIGKVMQLISYIKFFFGLFLIYAGVKSLEDDDDGAEAGDLVAVRMMKKVLGTRIQDSYDTVNHRLFVIDAETGRLSATLLVPLIFCIICSDVIFAVDSVSAKLAQINNQYIAYSSSVFALLGMRAMYHVIDDLVTCFDLLKYGICIILVFIGSELMVSGRFQVPEWIVILVIVSVFNFCIVASLIKKLIKPEARTNINSTSEASDCGASGISLPGSSGSPMKMLKHTNQDPQRPVSDGQTAELRKKLQTRFAAIEAQFPGETTHSQTPHHMTGAGDAGAGPTSQ